MSLINFFIINIFALFLAMPLVLLFSIYLIWSRQYLMKKLAQKMGLNYQYLFKERGNKDHNFLFGTYKGKKIKIYDHEFSIYGSTHGMGITETIVLMEDNIGDKEIFSFKKIKRRYFTFLGGNYSFLGTREIKRIVDNYIEKGKINFLELFLSRIGKFLVFYIFIFIISYFIIKFYLNINL